MTRAISGYHEEIKPFRDIEGLGGGFRYCRPGVPLFNESGDINTTNVTFPNLAAHIFFCETGVPLPSSVNGNATFIGKHAKKAVYLLFAKGQEGMPCETDGNVLTPDVLASLPMPIPSANLPIPSANLPVSSVSSVNLPSPPANLSVPSVNLSSPSANLSSPSENLPPLPVNLPSPSANPVVTPANLSLPPANLSIPLQSSLEEFEGIRVVYAEASTVSPDRLKAENVVFRQIPYRIDKN